MSIRYCCADKCFILNNIEVDGLACRLCESFGQCRCRCRTYMKGRPVLKPIRPEDLGIPHHFVFRPGMKNMYCCEEFCINLIQHEVDGLSCNFCRAYGQCRCGCVTWAKLKHKYKGGQWINNKYEDMAPFTYTMRGVDYCCPRLCFPLSKTNVSGVACNKCKSRGQCRCRCIMYMAWYPHCNSLVGKFNTRTFPIPP